MLSEQDRLLYQNRDLQRQIREQFDTITAQEIRLTIYEQRMRQQLAREKRLLWSLIVLMTYAILISAGLLMEGR